MSKVGHSLGLSFGLVDLVLLVMTAVGAVAAAYPVRVRGHLEWVAFTATCLAVVAVQSAFYVPDVRFRVSLLDLPVLVLAGLALATAMSRRSRRLGERDGDTALSRS